MLPREDPHDLLVLRRHLTDQLRGFVIGLVFAAAVGFVVYFALVR